jgi:ABC-2 type transport system ATP-binding protein
MVIEENQSITMQVEHENQSNDVLKHLINKGVYIHAFNEILPTLNEIFIQQVNE